MEETKNTMLDFEIEVVSDPYPEVAVPVPGGCNSSNQGCSNDTANPDP